MKIALWMTCLLCSLPLVGCSLILDTDGLICTQDDQCAGGTVCRAGECVVTDGGQLDGSSEDGDGGSGDGDREPGDGDAEPGDGDQDAEDGDADPGDGGGDPGCTDQCQQGEFRCENNQAQNCTDSGTNCLEWFGVANCTTQGLICEDWGEQAECVPCDSCTNLGFSDCLGNLARSCEGTAVGNCWVVQANCADPIPQICAQGGTCRAPGSCGNASCNAPGPHFSAMTYRQADFNRVTGTRPEPVVEDLVRGLMWQGCPEGTSGDLCTGTPSELEWASAIARCDSLEWGPTDAAIYDDWYLPDRFELQTLVAYGESSPAIDESRFPGNTGEYFWTSSTMALDPNYAWKVMFFGGNINGSSKTGVNPPYFRCVRRTTTEVHYGPRFTREPGTPPSEPVVTDHTTELVWQGCPLGYEGSDCLTPAANPDGGTYTSWPLINATQADALCTGLAWGGFSTGWRMPNIRELFSIVNDRVYEPAIYTEAFPVDPAAAYLFWSSDSRSSNRKTLDFEEGKVGENSPTSMIGLTRCVRDPE